MSGKSHWVYFCLLISYVKRALGRKEDEGKGKRSSLLSRKRSLFHGFLKNDTCIQRSRDIHQLKIKAKKKKLPGIGEIRKGSQGS